MNNHVVQPVADTATHLCLRNPFGGENNNGGCHTVLSTSQGAKLIAGVVLVAGGTILTAGVGDLLLATAAGIDTTEAAGLFESFDLALHAPWVLLPGLTLAGLGFGSIGWALSGSSCDQG